MRGGQGNMRVFQALVCGLWETVSHGRWAAAVSRCVTTATSDLAGAPFAPGHLNHYDPRLVFSLPGPGKG